MKRSSAPCDVPHATKGDSIKTEDLGALFAPIVAMPATAQGSAPFTGPSVGVQAGYLEHHFALEFEERDAGGKTNTARIAGFSYSQTSRYGARLAVRAGYALTPRLMGYALTGYGGNRYRICDGFDIGNGNEWGSSFIVGAGAEYRASPQIGARLQLLHVDI
jgi:outer membrane immunogenic protein